MKIFLTVGSMLPFDRLVGAVDAWAARHPEAQVFAQIGTTSAVPRHMQYAAMIGPQEYRAQFAAADLVVSHVGMGTVITAFECAKPLVMLARRPELQEVTSNHQLATAQWLVGRPGISVIDDVAGLDAAIAASAGAAGVSRIDSGTKDGLIAALRQFISA